MTMFSTMRSAMQSTRFTSVYPLSSDKIRGSTSLNGRIFNFETVFSPILVKSFKNQTLIESEFGVL
jgi:hypothetical protein